MITVNIINSNKLLIIFIIFFLSSCSIFKSEEKVTFNAFCDYHYYFITIKSTYDEVCIPVMGLRIDSMHILNSYYYDILYDTLQLRHNLSDTMSKYFRVRSTPRDAFLGMHPCAVLKRNEIDVEGFALDTVLKSKDDFPGYIQLNYDYTVGEDGSEKQNVNLDTTLTVTFVDNFNLIWYLLIQEKRIHYNIVW